MKVTNPFPGPRPYRRASDRALFFGREDMSCQLESTILANRCVTVFGPSGAGKSSLIRASVLPKLVESYDIRIARVDGWPEGEDPTAWLATTLAAHLRQGEQPEGFVAHEAVLSSAKQAARSSSRLLLVYLDQVEQILYPDRDREATGQFLDCLQALVELPLRSVRILISLREDYLGRFRDRVGDRKRLLHHGFRVGPLTVGELTGAVCQAAAVGTPQLIWSHEQMRPLMLQVRVPGQPSAETAEAQAAYAQIVCRTLFQMHADGKVVHEETTFAEPILHAYLEDTLADLGPLREAAQRLLEEHLITADGGRTLRTEKELLRLMPAEDLAAILCALEGAAILHAEEHQGSRYFEIGHDWLANRVFMQRRAREEEQELARREDELRREAARVREQHANLKELWWIHEQQKITIAKVRRERRTLIVVSALLSVLIMVAGGLGLWAWRGKRAAEAACQERP